MIPTKVNQTKELWQPFYEEELTDDDVQDISNNLGTFFQLLAEEKNRSQNI